MTKDTRFMMSLMLKNSMWDQINPIALSSNVRPGVWGRDALVAGLDCQRAVFERIPHLREYEGKAMGSVTVALPAEVGAALKRIKSDRGIHPIDFARAAIDLRLHTCKVLADMPTQELIPFVWASDLDTEDDALRATFKAAVMTLFAEVVERPQSVVDSLREKVKTKLDASPGRRIRFYRPDPTHLVELRRVAKSLDISVSDVVTICLEASK